MIKRESKIYWTSIEYNYSKESSKNDELKGGFVYAFVNANDVRDALDKLLKELKSQSLTPIDIEFMSPYDDEMEWETRQETEHFLGLYNESKKTNNVIFDNFYAYESGLDVV